jgi:hypothetical protein
MEPTVRPKVATKKPPTQIGVVLEKLHTRLEASDGYAAISTVEFQVLQNFYDSVVKAKAHLETSESPFYKGMELLSQSVG